MAPGPVPFPGGPGLDSESHPMPRPVGPAGIVGFMSHDADVPSTPFTPPTVQLPPDDLAAHRAAWPTVIGVISIVYAAFGLFANGCGTIFIYFGGATLSLMGIDGADFQLPLWLKIAQTVMGVFGVVLAIMLLAGAIGLIRRHASSVRLLRTWAVLAIVSTVLGIGIGFAAIQPNVELQMSIQEAILDKIEQDGGDTSDPRFADLNKDEETMRRESIRNLAIFGAIPIIYPVIIGFLLTGRGRTDHVETWQA